MPKHCTEVVLVEAVKAGGFAIVKVVVFEHPLASVAVTVTVPHKLVPVQGLEGGTLLQVLEPDQLIV